MDAKGPGAVERVIDPERHAALVRKVKRQRVELRRLNRALRLAQYLQDSALRRGREAEERLAALARSRLPPAPAPAPKRWWRR